MKQKRTFITLLLVLAILGLGIAYAAITTQTLQITGTAQATAAEDEINVIFTAATPAEGEDENISAAIGSDAKTATISVEGLTTQGDSETARYTITNMQEDMSAELNNAVVRFDSLNGTVTENEWFTVTCTALDGTTLSANNAEGNNASSSTTVDVTVTLRKTPVTEEDQLAAKADIFITIDADPISNAN